MPDGAQSFSHRHVVEAVVLSVHGIGAAGVFGLYCFCGVSMPCRQALTYNGISGSGRPFGGGYYTEADCLQACKEGACCEGTTCSVKPQCQCQGTGKTFKGVGTTCTPSTCAYCCDTGGLPALLELTISNFYSSRGTFMDFNPNRTYLLSTPEPEYNNGAQSGLRARSCLCYTTQQVSYDPAFRAAVSNSSSGEACLQASIFGPTAWVMMWRAGVGDSGMSGTSECTAGNTKFNNSLTVWINLQSRTSDFPNEISAVHMSRDAFSSNSMNTGLTREQFRMAVCGKTLNASGSVNTGHLHGACQNMLGVVSFDWTLRVSDLP